MRVTGIGAQQFGIQLTVLLSALPNLCGYHVFDQHIEQPEDEAAC